MTNAIKVLLQMPSGFLQLESTLRVFIILLQNKARFFRISLMSRKTKSNIENIPMQTFWFFQAL
jgi:hypothetical protein